MLKSCKPRGPTSAAAKTAAIVALGLLAACASPHRTLSNKDAGVADTSAPDSGGSTDDAPGADGTAVDAGKSGDAQTDVGPADAAGDAAGVADSADAASDVTLTADTSNADAPQADTQDAAPDTTGSDAIVDADADATDAIDADAIAASDAADTVGVDAPTDATKCFVGQPPAANEPNGIGPEPNTNCPAFDPPAFGGNTASLGAPELPVQLGVFAAGAFGAYEKGDFVPLTAGIQGGFHVWTAFRAQVPKATAQQIWLQVRAVGLDACKEVASAVVTQQAMTRDASDDGWYTMSGKLAPGMEVRFAGAKLADSPKFCGLWLDVRVQVLHIDSMTWGRSRVSLRTWDKVAKAP